jgi:glycosyltransferase involved in cell wall biosynthesis
VVPRERFAESIPSLDSILPTLGPSDRLVYVDGNSPKKVSAALQERQREHGFELIREESYLSPNHARNLALRQVSTPYVAFVDNDLLVTEGWLDRLVACAEETGAWLVGPLYLQGDPADRIVHMAGGDMSIEGPEGHRSCTTVHRFQGEPMDGIGVDLERQTCDFVEFHCVLARRDVFDELGLLDEQLLNTREHLDLCLAVWGAGGEVWFEPASEVTYSTPPPLALTDIPYFWLRWSDAWSSKSLAHFCEKYGIDPCYQERIKVMQGRRQVALMPVRNAVRPVAGKYGDKAVNKALRVVEPYVNRLVYR